ncbi:MAG TPA: winged helix-turn-helix transcriptional regulator [Chloroflexota bacterium]|nr:winged helix-turn-helix transcriptional regulator [Chloroflexota bacterium]
MLTHTLRQLQRNGLVERVPAARAAGSDAGSGAEVYRLTGLGKSLLEPVAALSRWAEEHTGALLAAQHAHNLAEEP